jgi:hypothetical protein
VGGDLDLDTAFDSPGSDFDGIDDAQEPQNAGALCGCTGRVGVAAALAE